MHASYIASQRQRRRLSWIVIHSTVQRDWGLAGWWRLVVGGATNIVTCGYKHLTTVVWDATLHILVDTF
jgi:hypothetical protein